MATSFWCDNDIELSADERRAINSLMRLSLRWPHSLLLFGGAGTTTSVRKRATDGSYFAGQEVAVIAIPSDGGDGGDRS